MLLSITHSEYDSLIISDSNDYLLIHTDKIPSVRDDANPFAAYTSKDEYSTKKCMMTLKGLSIAPVGHTVDEIKNFMNGLPIIDGDISEFSRIIENFYKETRYHNQIIYVFKLDENTFVFMNRYMEKALSHIVSFRSPNPEVSNIISKTFHISEANSRIHIGYGMKYSDESNNHYWMIPPAIFETLLYGANLKAEGKPVYDMFTKLKPSGKVRKIYAPDENIKSALRKVNSILCSTYEDRNKEFQVAYKSGKSIVDNANPHRKNPYMVKIDISDFFPSCSRELVKKYLRFMFLETEENLLDEFLDIILVDDSLVIGAPISGILANTIISKPVALMKKRCDKAGISFTVYADDMTFSSDTFLKKDFIESIFSSCMEAYKLNDRFKINPEKIVGVSNSRRRVTGVSINNVDELCVRRHMYREVRSILEHLSHDKAVTYSKHEISGKLAFITMVENSAKVNALLEKYKDIIISEKLMSEKTLEKRGVHV